MSTTTPAPVYLERNPRNAPIQSPLPEKERLVSGPRLLEVLWDAECRPSLRWLQEQQKNRMIPFVRLGRRVFFRPNEVQEAIASWTARPKRPVGRPRG